MLKKALCLLLALALLSAPAAAALEYPEKEHLPVDYDDMLPVTGFDERALLDALEELENACSRNRRRGTDGPAWERIQTLYDEILTELNILVTKTALAGIQYSAAGGAEPEAALYLELSNQQTRLFDRCYQCFAKLAVSPYRDVLDSSAGEGTAWSLAGYRRMSGEEAALWEEERMLLQAYDQVMSRGVPVLVDGQVWTEETLAESELGEEKYRAAAAALEQERNRAAAELYRRLVRLRESIAEANGYDSYTEYVYWAIYNRDYDPEDVESLREAAKADILPLQLQLAGRFSDQELRAVDVRSRKSGEEILDDIQPFIEAFDPEMGETFRFMRQHHLYDIEYDAAKLFTGYTATLPAYGSAFIFESPYGDYRDYSNLVHEFGHFNETFHAVRHSLWEEFSIDVGEIHSQALELMFTGDAGAIFGQECGEVYANLVLYGILGSILDGCLYDEFQMAAYQDPDMSAEELNRLFKELSEEYGYTYDPGVEEDPAWVENTHNFQDPLYFISYATSALSALDLWFLYLDSPQEAKEIYLDLSILSLSLPYRAAVEEVGLRDIFQPETIPALAEMLEARLEGRPVSYNGRQGFPWKTVMICVGLIYIAFCAVLMARALKIITSYSARREEAETPEFPQRDRGAPGRQENPAPWTRQEKKPPWEF